jgi:hypothetical protein
MPRSFVGSIAENYDRYLGPLFFHGYADEMAARLPVGRGMRVLETACGTGIVTERLLARLAGAGHPLPDGLHVTTPHVYPDRELVEPVDAGGLHHVAEQ